MNIIVYGMGTHGDVNPLVGLCEKLIEKGATVTLLSNEVFKCEAESCGIDFISVTPKSLYEQTYSNPRHWTSSGLNSHVAEYHVPAIIPTINEIERIHQDTPIDAIVGFGRHYGAGIAAEKHNIQFIPIILAPVSSNKILREEFSRFVLKNNGGRSSIRTWWKYNLYILKKKLALRKYYKSTFNKYINPIREKYGLEKVGKKGMNRTVKVSKNIALFPKWFTDTPSDWESNITFVGFPRFDPIDNKSRAKVDEIVDRVGLPIIAFAPGSAVVQIKEYLLQADTICAALGMHGIFVSRYGDRVDDKRFKYLTILRYVDFEYLFRKSLIVFHHGGVGTMAQAFAAGVPQVVVPMAYDQPSNAERAKSIKVASIIKKNDFCELEAIRSVYDLLDSKETKINAKYVKSTMEINRALDKAADRILS